MGGKASLYMIFSFSLIFLIAGYNFSSLTRRTVNNNVNYFYENAVHNSVVSVANLAASKFFFNNNFSGSGYQNIKYQVGKDPNDYALVNVTFVSIGTNNKKFTITSVYNGLHNDQAKDTVIFLTGPLSFAQFGYYMNIFPSNMWLGQGDLISGPFHTQTTLNTKGSPVFYGLASAKNGLNNLDTHNPKWTPVFNGGFQSGVDIPQPTNSTDIYAAASAGGRVFERSGNNRIDVKLQFNADATVTFKTSTNSGSSWSADSTKPLSTLAPNGVIYVNKGNLYIKGTVNGRCTIVANQGSVSSAGNVYLEDDIVYHDAITATGNPPTDPREFPNSYKVNGSDMLGIVATNYIEIVDNTANRSDINIHAALFSYSLGIRAASTLLSSVHGAINIVGGLSENTAQVTGVGTSSGITGGYNERIYFDQRFRTDAPPYYPTTGQQTVISWYETNWMPDPLKDF